MFFFCDNFQATRGLAIGTKKDILMLCDGIIISCQRRSLLAYWVGLQAVVALLWLHRGPSQINSSIPRGGGAQSFAMCLTSLWKPFLSLTIVAILDSSTMQGCLSPHCFCRLKWLWRQGGRSSLHGNVRHLGKRRALAMYRKPLQVVLNLTLDALICSILF